MTRKEIKQVIAEINKPGSELNLQYEKWRKLKMTVLVAEVLQFMASPDQTITTVPAIAGDPACTLLGYISGRSHSAADMVALDELQQTSTEIVPETYGGEE